VPRGGVVILRSNLPATAVGPTAWPNRLAPPPAGADGGTRQSDLSSAIRC